MVDKKNIVNNDFSKLFPIIVENTSDLVAVTTFDLKVVFLYANHSYKTLLGYDPEELLGTSCFDIIHPDDTKKLFPLLTKYFTNKATSFLTGADNVPSEIFQFRINSKSGVCHYFESTANIAKNKLIFISKDVSARKAAEEALKKSKQDLQDKFDDLERFHKIAIGRENKMIELKHEITRLKEELIRLKDSSS